MFNTGVLVKVARCIDKIRYKEINYLPTQYNQPARLVQSKSKAWVGLEKIIYDIILFSGINRDSALEFGVEYGYSTAVLANYFNKVIGVDTFSGDIHSGCHEDIYDMTKKNLVDFSNIELVKSDYKNYINAENKLFDMIHVDIVHTYEDTFACGLWSAEHSRCTIFHDTESFPSVKKAVANIASQTQKKFYNYRQCNGLGILI